MGRTQMDDTLYQRLLPVAQRLRFRRVGAALSVVWFVLALIAAVVWWLHRSGGLATGSLAGWNLSWWMLGGATLMTLVTAVVAWRSSPSVEQVAFELERRYPELDAVLITAVEQRPAPGQPYGFLQMDVMRKAVTHSYANEWPKLVPTWQLASLPLAGVVGLLLFAAALVGILGFSAPPSPPDPTIAFADAAVDKLNYDVLVEPGDAEVERGTSLLVLARFGGSFPPDASLVIRGLEPTEESTEKPTETRLPMRKSLDDPVFGARIAKVDGPLQYQVEFANAKSDEFNVSVFEFPALVRADATLSYPSYTELERKTVQDVRRLSVVEGTTVELDFYLNKPVRAAVLVPQDDDAGEPIELTLAETTLASSELPRESSLATTSSSASTTSARYRTTLQLERSQKFRLHLIDDDDRENRSPPRFVFNVLENKPPELKVAAPGRDIDASPLEEVALKASVYDDFGLKSFGLSYSIPGREEVELPLELLANSKDKAETGPAATQATQATQATKRSSAKKKQETDFLLALEDLEAQPDESVAYYFWAEDIGPDGQPRRVMGDLYFANVRHFEEIFRQGEAPPGGAPSPQQQQQQQGQNAQQAQELAEAQKEVINATWKLIRRERADAVSDLFRDDVTVVAEGQAAVIATLAELMAELQDDESKQTAEDVRALMSEAVVHLKAAAESDDVGELSAAIASEKAAYQALLKLRAREHEIVRQQQQQQQSQSQQSQNNRQQQQLEQLNLEEDENRYENEKTAQEQTEQSQQQQEQRQVLSRLRELARRQSDLNEQVKELQTALEEAKTPEEQEEIERRLKSLREQQEQMLRDTDELLERMQQEQNQQSMAEATEQLEQTRENLQQASEALQNREPSRAAAEGTRAQRELEELRDEFQTKTAGQFTEQMRQMRNEAESLEANEERLAQALQEELQGDLQGNLGQANQGQPAERPSLRGEEQPDSELSEQFSQQQKALEALRQQMRETIEEAETFEPLLAEELYDTYRDADLAQPEQALDAASRSLQRGWLNDAAEREAQAREGISELRSGIEKAAERVLGDETEALRAAQSNLDRLNRDLQQELESKGVADREQTGQRPNDEAGEGPTGQGQRGERQTDEAESGEQQAGERQSGDRSDGQPSENGVEAENPNRQPRSQGGTNPSESAEPREGQGQPNQQGEPEERAGDPQSGQPGGQAGGDQPGRGQSDENQPDENQSSENQSEGGQPGGSANGGNRANENADNSDLLERMRQLGDPSQAEQAEGGERGGMQLGPASGPGNQRMMQPISGDDYRQWSDRLRDVEEMIGDPELRAQAAQIREQARELRKEMKERHSAEPNWDLVKLKVAQPLAELQDRVAEELLRRSSKKALVPLDRDPVPAEFQDAVQKYYERLGSGR